jgi:hypothetical protein
MIKLTHIRKRESVVRRGETDFHRPSLCAAYHFLDVRKRKTGVRAERVCVLCTRHESVGAFPRGD